MKKFLSVVIAFLTICNISVTAQNKINRSTKTTKKTITQTINQSKSKNQVQPKEEI